MSKKSHEKKSNSKKISQTNDNVKITPYGYSVHNPEYIRHEALRNAIKDYGIFPILKQLNILKKYQSIPKNKEIFKQDLNFIKNIYDSNKDKREYISKINSRKNPNINKSRSKEKGINYVVGSRIKQRGGHESFSRDPSTSDNIMNDVNSFEEQIKINTIIDKQKICDQEGKCDIRNIVYEMHEVNGKQILYYTLGERDVNDILELDKLYMDSDRDKNSVLQNILDNRGLLIGIKVDDRFQGYCQYEPHNNMEVKIIWFCANKGFGTPLYIFIEKYFTFNNYIKIILVVSLEGIYATRRINFWYLMGFTTYDTLPEKNKIHMEKTIQ